MKRYYWKIWYIYLIFIVFATLASGLSVYASLALGWVVDDVINKDKDKFIFHMSFAVAGLCASLFVSLLNDFIFKPRAIRILNNGLRTTIALKINAMSYSEYSENKKGQYISWFTNDVDRIQTYYFSDIFVILEVIPGLGVMAYGFYAINWILGLIAFLSAISAILLPYLFSKKSLKRQNKSSQLAEEKNAQAVSLIGGYKEFSYRNQKVKFRKMISTVNKPYEKNDYKLKILLYSENWILNLITVGSQTLLSLVAIYLYTLNDTSSSMNISAGSALSAPVMAYTLLSHIFNGCGSIKNMWSVKDINKKFKTEVKNVEEYEPNPIEFKKLNINNLSLSYDEKQVFKDFNLEIGLNKKYLLVGKSGAGKTTLFKTIFGLIDDYEGKIVINDQKDYKQIDKRDIWNLIAYVPQSNIVYNVSMRDNLTLFDDSISDDKIIDVIKKVNLSSWLEQNSLDTILDNDNKNLSGGEVQRMAIARALLQNKEFMILDEITASLDKENRSSIEDLVGSLNKTILYISHTTDVNNKNFDKVISL
ncbi:ATP-binding cassette domain-containing protein [Spiroplasma tabanidicola]|uniref:ABC transporter ATP-binding protein n=1 Tax=Spiroplasma tabanidicola TaxID=324079 RepID=A0A6I6C629_9MOLU|nr:ABC transporter ATP-binding protein [Spiroplasma tabanidicola]QGS52377.1 ABC transporter ATP-binding protein [Spiroplasma tabanidicola]